MVSAGQRRLSLVPFNNLRWGVQDPTRATTYDGRRDHDERLIQPYKTCDVPSVGAFLPLATATTSFPPSNNGHLSISLKYCEWGISALKVRNPSPKASA